MQCKQFRCGKFRIGYDRHQAAGHGLHAGDPLDFRIGSMDIQVTGVDQPEQLLLRIKSKQRRIRQAFAQTFILPFLWPAARKNKLDPVGILTAADRLDDDVLSFFRR